MDQQLDVIPVQRTRKSKAKKKLVEPLLPEQKLPPNHIRFQLPFQVQDEGIIKSIQAFKLVKGKEILYKILCFLTVGLWWLLVRWELVLRIKTLMSQSNINSATHLKVISADDQEELLALTNEQLIINEKFGSYLIFRYRLYKYYFDPEHQQFMPIQSVFSNRISKDIYNQFSKGVSSSEMAQKLQLEYGNNSTEIPEKGISKILLDEILSPFYLFQVFSVSLWCVEKYYYYAGVIFVTSLISIIVTLKEMRENYNKMREMSAYQSEEIVYRGGSDYINIIDNSLKVQEAIKFSRIYVSSIELVPGDILEVRDNWTVPCDCILINGSCIINESMLTGESIPIVKTPLSYTQNVYNPLEDGKQCTLFSGTRCIDTRHQQKGKVPILAIVTQTGFSTMKGQLVRSILYPKQSKFSFYRDSMMFIGVLGIMAFIGFLVTIKSQIEDLQDGDLTYQQLIINMLDLVTITVPPALPTCLSIGISFAMARLQKKRIFCISPNRVIVAGKITIMCFDKTGTLTEDGLDLYGVRPVGYSEQKKELHFEDIIMKIPELVQNKSSSFSPESFTQISKQSIYSQSNLQPMHLMFESMSSCHGLTRVNGELIGDPLEIKMFESTECILQDENLFGQDEDIQAIIRKPSFLKQGDEQDVAIIKRFEFSSKLQRMSVIVKSIGDKRTRVHVKGSPEKIRELCRPESIPKSFLKILDFYAKSGFRILATAVKHLPDGEFNQREDVEKNLTFIGFLIMQNKLKPVTTSIIDKLQEAHIRTIMVTGDNVLTAISVARQCHLVRPDQAIFLGDVNQNGSLSWKDFDLKDNILNPDNLYPQNDLKDNPDIEIESFLEEEIENLKKSQFVQENLSNLKQSESKRRYSYRKSQRKSVKELEKELQASNIDHLVDDIVPWKSDENFVIAITGKAFSQMLKQIDTNPKARKVFGIMLERAQVFARMRPEEKALLIQHLQVINRKALCAMCGDGANDCGALKTADVGISLSEAEASIAAPFTSRIQDISCVIKVFREGRAALITSFQCFKYMALYSMIQFTSVTLLYMKGSNLGDWEFLYIDLFIIIPLAAFMGETKAYKQLSQFQPGKQQLIFQLQGSNLISFPVLFSVIGQTIIQMGFQMTVYLLVIHQSWYISAMTYHKAKGDSDDHLAMEHCFENTSIFLFANMQYVTQCLVFSIGKPFRRQFYTNKPFTFWSVFLIIFNFFILLKPQWPKEIWVKIFWLKLDYKPQFENSIPESWFFWLAGLSIINSFSNYLFEKYGVMYVTRYYRAKKRQILRRYRLPENPYLQVVDEN